LGQGWLRGGSRKDRRRKAHRLSLRHNRVRLGVEGLEERTLLAVLPVPLIVDPNTNYIKIAGADTFGISSPFPAQISATGDNNTPSVAVDPTDSQKLVAVWTEHDPNLAPLQTTIL